MFNLFCAGGVVLSVFMLWVLADFVGVNYLLSNFIGIAVATVWNYGTNANVTWGTARNKRNDGVESAKMRRAASRRDRISLTDLQGLVLQFTDSGPSLRPYGYKSWF